MRKRIIVLWFVFVCSMSGCVEKDAYINQGALPDELPEQIELSYMGEEKEDTDMDANNRKMIAELLQVEENHRSLRFILNGLNAVGAGRVQEAETEDASGEKVIWITAENGMIYRVYLSGSNGVDAIENVTTGEWPVRSER